jgi:hypothetical protein
MKNMSNSIKEVFKNNSDKLSNIHIEMSCCEHTFVVEYSYKNRSNLIGVEYFTYDNFTNEEFMKSIMDMYNRYAKNKRGMKSNIINY